MDRRELLGVFGAGAAGLASISAGFARAADEGHGHDEHIRTIGECAMVCNEAARHCLEQLKKAGPHAEHHAKAYEAATDCQAFCVLTISLMARSSSMAKYAYTACFEACKDCAAAAEILKDEITKKCIKACLEGEKACREMAGDPR